jgi:hypothetical protein
MLVIHLPDGPTAHFRLSNVKITPELKVYKHLVITCCSVSILRYISFLESICANIAVSFILHSVN